MMRPVTLATMTAEDITRDEFDFYRCEKCHRICTKLEWDAAMGVQGTGRACPCGGVKFSPTDVTWREYAQPQIIRYARLSLSGGGLNVSDEEQDREFADARLCEDLIKEARVEGLGDALIQEAVIALVKMQQQVDVLRPASKSSARTDESMWERLCDRWPWLRLEIVP
jgi:hypothetical protein